MTDLIVSSVHSGSAVAALLFPRAGVAGVVTPRLVISAALLLRVSRPQLRTHQGVPAG